VKSFSCLLDDRAAMSERYPRRLVHQPRSLFPAERATNWGDPPTGPKLLFSPSNVQSVRRLLLHPSSSPITNPGTWRCITGLSTFLDPGPDNPRASRFEATPHPWSAPTAHEPGPMSLVPLLLTYGCRPLCFARRRAGPGLFLISLHNRPCRVAGLASAMRLDRYGAAHCRDVARRGA